MIYCIPQGNYGNQIYCFNNAIKFCLVNNIDLSNLCMVHSRFFTNHKLKSFIHNNELSFKQSTYKFKNDFDERLYDTLHNSLIIRKCNIDDWKYKYSLRYKKCIYYDLKDCENVSYLNINSYNQYNNFVLCKCFSNWKFEDIGDYKKYLINSELKNELLNKYKFITDEDLFIINVRTQEYQTNINDIYLIFDFILNINKNAKFYISSNDIEWCKNNIIKYKEKIEFHNNINAYSDALLFSCGTNLISTYGTFSKSILYLSDTIKNHYSLKDIKK
jgi:hypothetical protein